MEYFISLACNVGNNNGQIPFAEELLGAQPGIKSVIAAHGESIGTYESSTSGFWLWESTTTSSATWANPFDSSAQGYRLFFRDDIGMIRTAIIGTPGYVFRGVSSFIRLARRMRHLVSIKTHSGYVD